MSFLHPGWFLLCLILPLIALGAFLARKSRGYAWKKFIAPRLRPQLVQQATSSRSWASLILALIGCALIITVIARPYQGETTKTEEINTRNIIIAVDTSRSMLTRDTSTDRMTAAKAMALEISHAFPNDRVGLIAFSNTSILLAPLTIDHSAIRETIAQLDTEIIPSGGSDLSSPVKLALKTFEKIGHSGNGLILISDGEDHSATITDIAERIEDANLLVSTVSVGTVEGGIIPDPNMQDGKYRDVRGSTVQSQMQPEALQQIAKAGSGTYQKASKNAPSNIRDSFTSLSGNQQQGRVISIPNDIYPWFLIPAVICLIGSAVVRSALFSSPPNTSPAAALTAFILLTLIRPVDASPLDDAKEAYGKKDYPGALAAFSKALESAKGEQRRAIQFSIASSAYHTGQWDEASRYFSYSLLTERKALRESSHYNLGNTLFRAAWSQFTPKENPDPDTASGKITSTYVVKDLTTAITRLQDAIGHYSATLTLNPAHTDAEHNRKEAEKLLKQLQEAEKDQQQEDQTKSGDGEQKQENEGDQKQPDQKGNGNQQGDNPKPGDGEQDPSDPNDPSEKGDDTEQPDDQSEQQTEKRPGESEEAYAARTLKENADAETRPVKSKFLRIRRSAKDW